MIPVNKRSRDSLEDQMWDELIITWMGASVSAMMIVGGLFWRFVVFPPMLVIRYFDGGEVWSFQGILHRDGRPDIPMWANVILIVCLIVGPVIYSITTKRWREAHNELRRRRLSPLGHQLLQ